MVDMFEEDFDSNDELQMKMNEILHFDEEKISNDKRLFYKLLKKKIFFLELLNNIEKNDDLSLVDTWLTNIKQTDRSIQKVLKKL